MSRHVPDSPHDMQAFHRKHNVNRHCARTEQKMCVRLFKKFFMALVDTVSKNLDQTLAQPTPSPIDAQR